MSSSLPVAPPSAGQARRWAGLAWAWLQGFRPEPVGANWRERLRAAVGAALGILVTALVCHGLAAAGSPWPWLVAPMGASAVLVFAVPSSPLAQPWSVVGGNTLSALVGVACVRWVGNPELAAGLAVGLAIGLMFMLRCLHPPGGATALLVALSGVSDPGFALSPVLVNSLLLAGMGIAYNSATRRAYPHRSHNHGATPASDAQAEAMDADLDAVLARHNQVLDISRDDLKALLHDTQMQAYQRKLAGLRCSDIMSRRLITVNAGTPAKQAWALLREHRIKALPVVDGSGAIVGILTPADFMRAAESDTQDAHSGGGLHSRLLTLRSWQRGTAADAQTVVGEIMTRQVRVASENRHLAELIPLFGSSGHHHIPIVNAERRLVGIVTQSDVVAALARPIAERV